MIYIQKHHTEDIPHHFDASCAMYGAMDLGMDCRLVHFNDIQNHTFDTLLRNNLFVGSVEFMREVFKHEGKKDVRLPENSNRKSEKITLGEAKKRASNGEKLFIKPVSIKLFTGFVLDGSAYSCIKDLPDDVPVLAYQPFREKITSEWRIYVHNHKVVYVANYAGDFNFASQSEYAKLKNIILQNKEKGFPCAYTMDIAVFPITQTEIVEYNDMWAIGNYGMPNDMYVRMLRDRYFEIMKK